MTTTRDVVRGGASAPLEVQTYGQIPNVLDLPNLIKIQLDSFDWFKREGLRELLNEISPIQDFTGSKMDLIFGDYEFREPKHRPGRVPRTRHDLRRAALRRCRAPHQGIRRNQGAAPLLRRLPAHDRPRARSSSTAPSASLSPSSSARRACTTRIETDPATGKRLCYAKLIPNRGAWLEFETSNRDVVYVKVDRKRKIPVSTLIRAIDVPGLLPGDRDNPRFAKYFAQTRSRPATTTRARDAGRCANSSAKLGTDERLLAMFEAVDTQRHPPVPADHHQQGTARPLRRQARGPARVLPQAFAPATRRPWTTPATC